MSTILITGAGGQVGQECQIVQSDFSNFKFHYAKRSQLDICDPEALKATFAAIRPDYVINCAAYTAVDRAEREAPEAFRINEEAVVSLADACNAFDAHLLHFSTDYVYRGDLNRPLRETDPVAPIGAYARSKYAGELALRQRLPSATIIRTSWIYSTFGNNFLKTMQRLGQERDHLRVVYDQVGTPTYARDLVRAVLQLFTQVESGTSPSSALAGTFNYSNEGVTSWYDFALAIMELSQIDCPIEAIESKDFPTEADRPNYSVLNKEKIKTTFQLAVPHWRAALQRCVSAQRQPIGSNAG